MSTQTPINSNTERKQAYEAKVKAQLDKLNAQIEELKAKAEQAKAETAVTYHSSLEEVYAKRDAAQHKLEELQQAGEDAWLDIQIGFEKAWNDLSQAFSDAGKKFQ